MFYLKKGEGGIMKHTFGHLIGKELKDFNVTEKCITITTKCGLEEKIFAKDYFGPFAEYSDLENSRFAMFGRTIDEIEIHDDGKVTIALNHILYSFHIFGINEIIEVRRGENKYELLLIAKPYIYDDKWKLHYIKSGNDWLISEFGTSDIDVYEFAKEYDVINHPSIRLMTVLQ
jgi:hypothetical protein